MIPLFALCVFLLQARYYTCTKNETFILKYKWTTVNFTWPSWELYQKAVKSKTYIPENPEIKGIKIYKDDMYFAIPLYKPGTPVTLATAKKNDWKNGTVTPFPSWSENVNPKNCSTFQSVQGFEIDNQGVMWVIDGERKNNQTDCPCKLVMLDLNQRGRRIHSYTFPNDLCLRDGGFLNDIVIDETDGTYAYITDASPIDPGLVIYSKKMNTSWKIRDKSMFADLEAADYLMNGSLIRNLDPVDGIALSPKLSPESKGTEKMVYYSAVTSFNLYGISTNILKDEDTCKRDQWRRNVTLVGKKQSQSDGMVVNKNGDLYYSLIPLSAVGVWNIKKPFNTSKILDRNLSLLKEPNCFAFDGDELYLLSDKTITSLNTTSVSYLKH